MEIFTIILTALLGGGACGTVATWFFNKRSLIYKTNFERKQSRYTHIIALLEFYLNPGCVVFMAHKPSWEYSKLNIEENKVKCLGELAINCRQIMFLTNNKKLIQSYEQFLITPTEETVKILIENFRKDLWR